MPDPDVDQRLTAIEQRLERLEALLRLIPPVPVQVPDHFERVAARPRPAEAAVPVYAAPPRRALEQTIGLRWAGWIGALVLVVGAGMGIKLAYDRGWLPAASPAVRLGLMAMAGIGLIGVGELIYRRVSDVSAAGFYGAGVAVLFLVSYAGHAFYGLYGRDLALLLMVGATVIGAAVARRGDLASIAVLAIVGGGLGPLLLPEQSTDATGFLLYLLALQAVGLSLAWWGGGRKWWVLRGVSLTTTAVWITASLGTAALERTPVTLGFILLYAVLYHAEMVASASVEGAELSVTFGLLVTAATTAVVLYTFHDATAFVRTTWVVGFAAAAGTAAVACRTLGRRSAAMRGVALGFAVQSAALLALAVPIAFGGVWVAVGWGGLAVAMAVVGWRLVLPVATCAAPALWLLALVDLCLNANATLGHPAVRWLSIAHQPLVDTLVIAWLLALAGHAIAVLLDRSLAPREHDERFGVAVAAAAALVWTVASLDLLPPLPATFASLVYAWLLVATAQPLPELAPQACIVLVAVAAKWMALDAFAPDATASLVNPTIGLGLLILITLLLARQSLRRVALPAAFDAGRFALAAALVLVLLWAGSLAVDAAGRLYTERDVGVLDAGLVEQVALSIFWSVFAVASIVTGFARRAAALRYFGLALFAVTLLKVVTVDLSQVGTGYRILSFLGLGALLLGTSVVYGKLSPVLLAAGEGGATAPRSDPAVESA